MGRDERRWWGTVPPSGGESVGKAPVDGGRGQSADARAKVHEVMSVRRSEDSLDRRLPPTAALSNLHKLGTDVSSIQSTSTTDAASRPQA